MSAAAALSAFLLGCGENDRFKPRIEAAGQTRVLVLPQRLSETIAARYSHFRVPRSEDMTGGWSRYPKADSLPYACWGDFNGDGMTDTALLLLAGTTWQLVVFHARRDGGYDVLKPRGFPGPAGSFESNNPVQTVRLFAVPAGRRVVVGDGLALEPQPNDSFALFLLSDAASGLHYRWGAAPGSEDAEIRRVGFYSSSRYNLLTD